MATLKDSSDFIRHVPCGECGSSDANSLYSDGHQYCFACETHTPAPEAREGTATMERITATPIKERGIIEAGDAVALIKRGIDQETCEKFHYTTGRYDGRAVQIAPYTDERGRVVAQKLRFPGKDFSVRGDIRHALLFGQHLWPRGGKRVVVTEGEIDALSYSQMTNLTWPVVSVPSGASGAVKAIKKQLDWLESYEEVVFLFDQDEPGRKAAQECADILLPGKAKIATLPLKDANEMLRAGLIQDTLKAVWNAKMQRPDGIVDFGVLVEASLEKPSMGLPWPWPKLTDLTYGISPGKLIVLGAGSGAGKTDFIFEVATNLWSLGETLGLCLLECSRWETPRRFCGKLDSAMYHIPGSDEEAYKATAARVVESGRVFPYDHRGTTEWDVIYPKLRWMAAQGCKHLFVDNLTAIVAEEADENVAIKMIMGDLGTLVQEFEATLYLVSHLTTADGTPHEEGGRVKSRHLRGSRTIIFWAHYIFGMERNQQDADPHIRNQSTIRILKDRTTGRATGNTVLLQYDPDTGRLLEAVENTRPTLMENAPFDVEETPDAASDF